MTIPQNLGNPFTLEYLFVIIISPYIHVKMVLPEVYCLRCNLHVEADLVLEYKQRSPVCVRAAPTVYGDSVLTCLKYNRSQSLFENRVSGVYHVATSVSSVTTATLWTEGIVSTISSQATCFIASACAQLPGLNFRLFIHFVADINGRVRGYQA